MDVERQNSDRNALARAQEGQSDRVRFEAEFKALRLTLQERRCLPEDDPVSRAQIMRAKQISPIHILVGRPEPTSRREKQPHFLPAGLIGGLKIAGLCAVAAALYYGPPYHTCRQLKEHGMFYSGTTVRSCVQERLDARTDPLQDLATRLRTAL